GDARDNMPLYQPEQSAAAAVVHGNQEAGVAFTAHTTEDPHVGRAFSRGCISPWRRRFRLPPQCSRVHRWDRRSGAPGAPPVACGGSTQRCSYASLQRRKCEL
ncbi:hypothetical protein M514_18281, partial [Trichuris suis]